MWCSMLQMCFWQYSTDISFIQSFFVSSTKALALEGCSSASFLFRICHRVEMGTVSMPLQYCDLCCHLTILHFFGVVDRNTIIHKHCAFMSVHVIRQLFFEQFHMLFHIHGGTRGQKVQSSGSRIAKKIIWLGGCFVVDIVYLSANLFPGCLLTCQVHTTICSTGNSSENKTLPHCSAVQCSYFLAKSKCLNFIAEVRRGIRTGMYDFRPNSLLRHRETVIKLTFVPFPSKAARIILHELGGVHVAMWFIM